MPTAVAQPRRGEELQAAVVAVAGVDVPVAGRLALGDAVPHGRAGEVEAGARASHSCSGPGVARRGRGGAGAGRCFVPTRTIWSTGAFVTVEETCVVETTLPSTTVVRTVTVRTPATPARETLVWSR